MLALIMCIPMAPIFFLYNLYAGKTLVDPSRTELGLGVSAEIAQLPESSGPPVPLAPQMEVGKKWELTCTFSSPVDPVSELPPGAEPDSHFESELKRRGGTWRFEIVGKGAAGWRIGLHPADDRTDTRELRPGGVLLWQTNGNLSWEGEPPIRLSRQTATQDANRTPGRALSIREALLISTGIWIPGPLPGTARAFSLLEKAPRIPTFKGVSILDRFGMDVADMDTFPPEGGCYCVGTEKGDILFRFLSYRRRPIIGDPWTGRMELVYRGSHRAPADHPWLASGRLEIREVFDMQRDDVTTARADHVVVISQVAKLLED